MKLDYFLRSVTKFLLAKYYEGRSIKWKSTIDFKIDDVANQVLNGEPGGGRCPSRYFY